MHEYLSNISLTVCSESVKDSTVRRDEEVKSTGGLDKAVESERKRGTGRLLVMEVGTSGGGGSMTHLLLITQNN